MELKRLKEIRNEHEETQKDIADKLGVSKGTYAMNEIGNDTITLNNLTKFCDIYKVSVDYIFELSNKKSYKNSKSLFDKEILKDRIKICRKEEKYTQDKIGKLLNIDHSVWCRYELGVTTIPTTFLYIIAKEFNISADYLLGRIDEKIELKKEN